MEKLVNKIITGRLMNQEIEVIYKKYLKMNDEEKSNEKLHSKN